MENGATPLFSRGASVQFFEPNCFSTPSDIGCPPEGSTCIDVTVNGPPADGTTGVCDGTQAPGSKCAACSCNCEVVSQPALPAFSQIVGSDTSIKPGAEGLNLSYPPVPAYASDNYECDINPVRLMRPLMRTQCVFFSPGPSMLGHATAVRAAVPFDAVLRPHCHTGPVTDCALAAFATSAPSSSHLTPFTPQTLTEGPECSYTVQATTARACSASGNPDIFPVNCSESCPLATPSASPSPSPMPSTSAAAGFAPSVAVNVADRVGFTFLGAALAGGGVALFLAGAQRGWWGAPSVARGYKPALAGYGAVPATSV